MITISPDTLWFIAAAITMVVVAVAILMLPWLRGKVDQGMDREAFNIQVYRDQLAELETEMAENRLSKEQYQRAREDLERGILEDTRGAPSPDGQPGASPGPPPQGPMGGGMPPRPANPNAGRWAIAVIGVGLPLLALILYGIINVSLEILMPDKAANTAPAARPGAAAPAAASGQFSVEEMVDRLAARLQQNPNDARGWTMLGRSYTVMRRYTDARDAYAKAYGLKSAAGPLIPPDADLVADYAESISRTNDNKITPEVAKLVDEALELDRSHEKALWLGGMAAFRAEDYRLAAKRWRRLTGLLPAGSDMANMVAGALEEADIRAGNTKVQLPEDQEATPSSPASSSPGASGATQ